MKNSKIKIAYLIPGCGVSGGIAVVCHHVNRLLDRGHDVMLISESAEREIAWFPNQRVPIIGMTEIPIDLDVLVATSWSTSFRVAVLPARHKFYFVQSDETRFHPQDSSWEHITRLSYTFGFNYLTEARWIKRWLKESFGHEAELVPNGLDPRIFHPAEPLEPRGSKPRILLEGAIGLPYKGMAEAFEAVKDLDVEVWCVSSYGKPKPGWRCDRFFEQVPMMEMKRIYSSCDILLKLSRVEGFFGPPMEMMACGGACVVGEVTGFDEYIEPEVNAIVVDPLNPKQAADALRRILNNSMLFDQLVKAGRETAERWSWDSSIDILERRFLDAVAGIKAAPRGILQDATWRSISYFYWQLRGEELVTASSIDFNNSKSQNAVVRQDVQNLTAGLSIEIDPTERVLSRLRGMPTFRRICKIAWYVFQKFPRIRALILK